MKSQRVIVVVLILSLAWLLSLHVSAIENFKEATYHPGDIVRAEFETAAGRTIAFDFKGLAHGLLLREIRPGHYAGEFMVLPSMCPYQGDLEMRDLNTGELLESSRVRFVPAGRQAVQAQVTPDETMYFAFDDTIRVQTIVVKNGNEKLIFPEDITIKNNLFTCKIENDQPVTVSAVTVDGELLSLNLTRH